jgi:hypothetical protein
VVAVSLLSGPDQPPHFKQQILLSVFLILTVNMLLASFMLHKVQKYFNGFGFRGKEENIRWLSL